LARRKEKAAGAARKLREEAAGAARGDVPRLEPRNEERRGGRSRKRGRSKARA